MWYHQETSPLQKNLPRTTANSSNAYNTIARHTLHHSYEPATSIKNKKKIVNHQSITRVHKPLKAFAGQSAHTILPAPTSDKTDVYIPDTKSDTEHRKDKKCQSTNQSMHDNGTWKKKECNFCLPKPNNSHCTIIVIPSWATEPKIKATLCTFNSTKVSNAYQKSLCTFNINDSNQTYEIMKSTYPLRRRQKLQRLYGLMVSIRQEALTGINIFRTIWYHHHTDISFNDT